MNFLFKSVARGSRGLCGVSVSTPTLDFFFFFLGSGGCFYCTWHNGSVSGIKGDINKIKYLAYSCLREMLPSLFLGPESFELSPLLWQIVP